MQGYLDKDNIYYINRNKNFPPSMLSAYILKNVSGKYI